MIFPFQPSIYNLGFTDIVFIVTIFYFTKSICEILGY